MPINAMRNLAALLAVQYCLLPGAAAAGERVDETREVNPQGLVRVHCTRGDLTIEGWDRDQIQVTGELDDLARDLVFEAADDQTLIRVRMPSSDVNRGDGSDLLIRLPHSAALQVDAVSADVDVRDVRGVLAIRTVSGDVAAKGVVDRIHVNTTSGDVDLRDGRGRVKIRTTSGDTEVDMATTDVQVDTVSGDIELKLDGFDSVVANTVSADLELAGRLNPGGKLEANSVSGEVELMLEPPIDALLDLRTGPGGEIVNGLSDDEPYRMENRGMRLDVALGDALGDGAGRIRVVTVNGEISLEAR